MATLAALSFLLPLPSKLLVFLVLKLRLFFRDLCRRVRAQTGDERAGQYLLQRISLEVQRGNAASVLGSVS